MGGLCFSFGGGSEICCFCFFLVKQYCLCVSVKVEHRAFTFPSPSFLPHSVTDLFKLGLLFVQRGW